MNKLEEIFGLKNVISKEISAFSGKCLVQWPARSPDLSPLDFWAWSRLKSLGLDATSRGYYRNRKHCKQKLAQVWNEISSEELYRACTKGVVVLTERIFSI